MPPIYLLIAAAISMYGYFLLDSMTFEPLLFISISCAATAYAYEDEFNEYKGWQRTIVIILALLALPASFGGLPTYFATRLVVTGEGSEKVRSKPLFFFASLGLVTASMTLVLLLISLQSPYIK